MSISLRKILLGKPLATSQAIHTRLPKRLALAVFSSDALSSTAYATEEVLRVLMVYAISGASVPALGLAWPIGLAIAALLVVVALSYRQTIFAYPGGASAYLVSKDNLGTTASLVAAASLLVDYILTVAVSVSAGIAAVISAIPALQRYVVPLCLLAIAFVTVANLRGSKESGGVFAVPTYGFVFSMLFMIALGLFRLWTGGPPPAPEGVAFTVASATDEMLRDHGMNELGAVTFFVILRAFTSGCTALTGIEAISDGIPAFKKPEAKNAATTLMIMVVILTTMFLGMTYIAREFQIPAIPEHAQGYETVISQIGKRVFVGGMGWYYWILMAFSAAILIVAANTAYQDFPRLASLLARDRFLPRQLGDLGDRLVFSNGILALAFFAAALVVAFSGSVSSLLPLYAVGVFTSFTLSQASMVRKWLRDRGQGWQASMLMNLFGALATGVVLVVIAITKFNAGQPIEWLPRLPFGTAEDGTPGTVIHYGAWLVIALVPLLVALFRKINGHYQEVSRYLRSSEFPRLQSSNSIHHTVLVLVPGLHRGIFPALEYAQSLSPAARAVHIEMDPTNTPTLKELWEQHIEDMPLVILESPYRNLREPIVEYVRQVMDERDDDEVTIVIPELVATRKWWHPILHNTSAAAIRRALGQYPGVVVTSFRYFADSEIEARRRVPPGPEKAVAAEAQNT